MADSETRPLVDSTQQVTSNTPATHLKNPKRVAAGKAIAEKTRQAREALKKALAEAQVIIANKTLQKKADPVEKSADDTPAAETTKTVLTTTQWLSVLSIFVSMVGLYYKREEIKKVFAPKNPPKTPRNTPVDFTLPPLKLKEKEAFDRWIKSN